MYFFYLAAIQVEASANVRKRSLFSKRAKEVVGRRAKSITPKTNQKKKKVRIYKRYIQKKFSPSIMRDVIGNLSKSQVEWVKSTGFGELLHFRMEHYAHNLGYNIAESFDGKSCSVKLKAGVIKIDDRVVHSVMGLPIGDEIIICNEDSAVCDIWAEQFSGFVSSQISPLMVRDKILENRQADTNFKWNFLVMLYNFFIESNQNLFLKRDILRFSRNIENCGKYNWCQILVEKLKKTHTYWAANTKRHFAGPLAFLIVSYSCLKLYTWCTLNGSNMIIIVICLFSICMCAKYGTGTLFVFLQPIQLTVLGQTYLYANVKKLIQKKNVLERVYYLNYVMGQM